jgi:hypothetical protein
MRTYDLTENVLNIAICYHWSISVRNYPVLLLTETPTKETAIFTRMALYILQLRQWICSRNFGKKGSFWRGRGHRSWGLIYLFILFMLSSWKVYVPKQSKKHTATEGEYWKCYQQQHNGYCLHMSLETWSGGLIKGSGGLLQHILGNTDLCFMFSEIWNAICSSWVQF